MRRFPISAPRYSAPVGPIPGPSAPLSPARAEDGFPRYVRLRLGVPTEPRAGHSRLFLTHFTWAEEPGQSPIWSKLDYSRRSTADGTLGGWIGAGVAWSAEMGRGS